MLYSITDKLYKQLHAIMWLSHRRSAAYLLSLAPSKTNLGLLRSFPSQAPTYILLSLKQLCSGIQPILICHHLTVRKAILIPFVLWHLRINRNNHLNATKHPVSLRHLINQVLEYNHLAINPRHLPKHSH